jgi:hypothetical protein
MSSLWKAKKFGEFSRSQILALGNVPFCCKRETAEFCGIASVWSMPALSGS